MPSSSDLILTLILPLILNLSSCSGAHTASQQPMPPLLRPFGGRRNYGSWGRERKEGEREGERTKLRERHRRAITSRMLSGLRQYGNFQLSARADMNDVLTALARQVGWVMETDGTTYRDSAPPSSPSAKMRGIINNYCQLVDPEGVREELKHLKLLHVDGVVVECWWGIVEGWDPQKFSWAGYRELFMMIREFQLNVQVYYDFMRSFQTEFDDLFVEGLISAVDIGLGASGELKFPSFSEIMGWRYPGIGEFQCYDRYLQQKLQKAAKLRGHSY